MFSMVTTRNLAHVTVPKSESGPDTLASLTNIMIPNISNDLSPMSDLAPFTMGPKIPGTIFLYD